MLCRRFRCGYSRYVILRCQVWQLIRTVEDIPKLTTRFHRVESTGRSFEGTGIGLALAMELVQIHGGTMSISSQTRDQNPSAHGSQFRVRMPWGYEHLPRNAVDPSGTVTSFGGYGRGLVEEAMQWMRFARGDNFGSRASAGGSAEENSEPGASGDLQGRKNGDSSTFYFEKVRPSAPFGYTDGL